MIGLAEDIAGSYINLGQPEKAKYYWSDMTETAAGEFGRNSYEYLDSLSNLFNFLDNNGFESEADELYIVYTELEAKLNSAKLSGREYDEAVEEAKHQYDRGNFTLARELHERIVASTPSLPGSLSVLSLLGHTMDPLAVYASKLDSEALTLQNRGEFSKAIRLYEEIIEIVETSFGKENLRVGYALNNLGDAKIAAGNLAGAKETFSQCLQVMNHPLNRENENRVKMIENYARVVYEYSLSYAPELNSAKKLTEEFEKRNAPEDYAKSIHIRMVIPKENEPPLETMIRRFEARVAFYESIGNYNIALRLLEDISELCSVYYIFEPEKAIMAWLALANGYVHQSDFGRAEKIYLSTLSFVQKNLPPDSFEYIFILHMIGIFYGETGDYKKARKFLEKAFGLSLKLPERIRELEYQLKKDLITAYHQDQGLESGELIKEMLSEFAPEEITDPIKMQLFASYYSQFMELEKAESLYKKAIAVLKEEKGEWNLDYALAISNLANMYRFQKKFSEALTLYQQSLRIRETELGRDHPKLTASLSRLALIYSALGYGSLAVETVERIISIDDKVIANMFGFGSRDQKLAFLESISSNTDLCMSVILRFSSSIPGLPALGLKLVQKRKSILSGMLLTKELQETENAGKIRAKEELAQLKRGIASASQDATPEFAELVGQRIAELEKQLNIGGFIPDDNTDLTKLFTGIKPNTAGLEILKIRNFQFDADLSKGELEAVSYYIGFLVTGDNPEKIGLIDFGPAGVIDGDVTILRDLIRQKKDIYSSVKALSDRLIVPLIRHIGGVHNLIICPDSDLSLLPFDLLLFNGRPLIDRFIISRAEKLSTAFVQDSSSMAGEALIIASPDYFALYGSQGSENPRTLFIPLEGTLQEGEKVAAITSGRLVLGEEASKEFFESIHSPVILHVATHAFYGRSFPGFENMPLLKSGLALAGANDGSDTNVGIIFAEEISLLLDMAFTELVVLSACDTAQGETVGKEGVFGLEKAFKAAGAKRVVVSLWEVPDKAAMLLMEEFYSNMYKGYDVALSLTTAKRTLREKMPEPIYWSSFVLNGNTASFPLPGL